MKSKNGFLILSFFFIFALLGASYVNLPSSTPSSSPAPVSDHGAGEAEKEPSPWGEPPSAIGSTERVQLPSFEFELNALIPQLHARFGLAERNDIIFRPLRSNGYLYERPGGILEFQVLENPRSIRYRLAQVNQDLDIVRTIVENTTPDKKLSVPLPDQEDALFVLSLETLGEYDRAIDTAIYLIEIVPQIIQAELSLDQAVFQANQRSETVLHLKNFGPNTLYIGGGYILEKYENGNWFRVPLRQSVTAVLHRVSAGEVHSQPFQVPEHLPAGHYRVVKDFQARGVSYTSTEETTGHYIHLAAKFEIVGDG